MELRELLSAAAERFYGLVVRFDVKEQLQPLEAMLQSQNALQWTAEEVGLLLDVVHDVLVGLPASALTERRVLATVQVMQPLLPSVICRICYTTRTTQVLDQLYAAVYVMALLLPHCSMMRAHVVHAVNHSLLPLLDLLLANGDQVFEESDDRFLWIAKAVYLLLEECGAQAFMLDWAPFLPLVHCQHAQTQWYARQTISVLLCMSQPMREQFLALFDASISNSSSSSSSSSGDADPDPVGFQLARQHSSLLVNHHAAATDSWTALRRQMSETLERQHDSKHSSSSNGACMSDALLLDPVFAQLLPVVGGVVLPSFAPHVTAAMGATKLQSSSSSSSSSFQQPQRLVNVASTARNLRSIGLALCLKSPVLLEGPSGAGKSTLVTECSLSCKQSQVISIYLDDQIDSKTLLGSYTCTDIPGEFAWAPGSITRAMLTGAWVVIEDIDRAPFEIVSALVPLFEHRSIFLMGRGTTITAHPRFQLFATTSTPLERVHGENANLLKSLFTRVVVDPMSAEERKTVILHRWPLVATRNHRKNSNNFIASGRNSSRSMRCSMIIANSSCSFRGGTQISVKRFRSAGDNSFLPKSPPGFIVANNLKCSSAVSASVTSPAFSARNSVRDGSKTELSLSITASSPRLISSTNNNSPSRMARTRAPSTHSNKASRRARCPFTRTLEACSCFSAALPAIFNTDLMVVPASTSLPSASSSSWSSAPSTAPCLRTKISFSTAKDTCLNVSFRSSTPTASSHVNNASWRCNSLQSAFHVS